MGLNKGGTNGTQYNFPKRQDRRNYRCIFRRISRLQRQHNLLCKNRPAFKLLPIVGISRDKTGSRRRIQGFTFRAPVNLQSRPTCCSQQTAKFRKGNFPNESTARRNFRPAEMQMKLCCGLTVGTKPFEYIGKDKNFLYFNCPNCGSTKVIKRKERKNEKTNTSNTNTVHSQHR